MQTRNQHQDLARVIDELPGQLLLLSEAGSVLHVNAAAAGALGSAEYDAVRAAAVSIAQAALRDDTSGVPRLASSTTDVSTVLGRIRLRATLAPSNLGSSRSLLFSLERLDRLPGGGWAHKFKLTCQEARVAELLAQRRSNGEIAAALCISEHTARHHTERVLGKLGARRRTDVEKILSAERSPDPHAH